jgi:outer membrane biosynthesis protein TonB
MSATIVRALLWLALLGVIGAGLTVCSGQTPTQLPPTVEEVAVRPSPTRVQSTDVGVPPSPTPAPETATPEPPSPTPPPPTDTPEPASPTSPPPTDTPVSPTDTPEPEAEEVSPTDTPEPEPEPDVDVASLSSDNCIGCHTSQETLQALAEEKEVKSEATSGEG